MRFRNLPIQRKMTWIIMLTSISALLITGVMFFAVKVRSAKSDLVKEMSSIAAIIGANSQAALEFDDRKAGENTLASLKEDKRIISATLHDASNRVFATFRRPHEREGLLEESLSSSHTIIRRPIHIGDKWIGYINLEVDSMAGIYQRVNEFAAIAALVLLMAAVGAYLLSSRLQRVISAPIIDLAETASRVSRAKDYSIRAKKAGTDEVGILIDRFNEMLEQIRQRDNSLQDSEHQMRLITDSLPVLISYVSHDERYRFINHAYEQWFGKPRSEVIGRKVSDIVGDEAYRTAQPYIKKVLTGEPAEFEASMPYSDAGLRYVTSTLVPDIDPHGGHVRGYFALVSDISDRKRSENELKVLNERLEQRVLERSHELRQSQEMLRRSERLASIGTLAAGMAHEIRNPVNSISLAAQHALRYQKELSSPMHKILDTIAAEAKRCGTIIKNILLFAKSEKTSKTLEDLNEVVRKSVTLAKTYAVSLTAEVNTELSPQLQKVLINTTEIEQVMVNLINNAMEASPDGVIIDIATKQIGNRVMVTIKDNGPGIPEEALSRVFDPFFSTKRRQGNTGLGLSLCHGIISQHGGNLNVQSTTGTGTVFTIELPVPALSGIQPEQAEAR